MSRQIAITLTNPGAESGTTGWTDELGGLGTRADTPSPHSGSAYFFGGAYAETRARQRVDLVAAGASATSLDSGGCSAAVGWWQASYDGTNDPGACGLRFLDASLSVLSTSMATDSLVSPALTWSERSHSAAIPAGTRYMDVLIHATRAAGTNNDGYFDDITATVTVPDVTVNVPSIGGAGSILAPSIPISQPPAIVGVGRLLAPVAIAGAIIPAMAGGGGLSAPSARWSVPDDQLPTCQVIYTLTLTGDADGLDDIVIPMDSFQSRLSADAIHYLSASIPNSRAWGDAIASRRQGQWIVKKGLLRSEYALRQAILRYEAAAEAEVVAFKSSTFGGWLMAMAASAGLTTAGLLEQYTVPAYWPGADRVVPAMKHILDGDPTNAAFIQWFVENGYSGSTDLDWREAVRLLQTPAWLLAATGGYYASWRQLCGLDGGHAYVSSSILDLTDAKNARQAELSALQADPADWSAGGTVLAEIIRVDYQSLSWARGSEGDSATITGQSTVSVGASKSVSISGVQYEALDTSAKRRLRCEVSLWLAPGDVATWGDESMVVGEVQHIVSVGESYMEITEA